MRVVVATEHRFIRLPDGSVCSETKGREYRFWQRYLSVFDEVFVVARIRSAEKQSFEDSIASGPDVKFCELAAYKGPLEYLFQKNAIKKQIQSIYSTTFAYILRVPGQVGNLVWQQLNRHNHPYAVEVVGDPYEVFAPGTMRHPLRPLFRYWFSRQLRLQCVKAQAAAYVTKKALQERYPPADTAFQTHYSSVELPATAFVKQSRNYRVDRRFPLRLVSVGNMAQMYKGHDTLIKATAICVGRGLEIELTIVGEGRHRAELMELAQQNGIADRVEFTGSLPAGTPIQKQLDQADLFVLASRTEGLPRAVIEAMARGLPCIATTVGGLPELLSMDCLVPPDNAAVLSEKIAHFISDPRILTEQSKRNFQKAKAYEINTLQEKRVQFYQQVKAATESWINARMSSS